MPRPRKFTNLTRPKPINLILPGLGRGVGRDKDRFRTSSGTKHPEVFQARHAMVQDLAQRLQFSALHAVLDQRCTMTELHNAYRLGNAALAALISQHSGKLVAPLLRAYSRQSKRKDKAKTVTRIERFLEAVGRRGERLGKDTDEAAQVKQRRLWRERVSTSEITPAAVAEFLAELPSLRHTAASVETSGSTKNRYRAAIGGFATWLVRHGHLDKHPIAFKAVEKAPENPPQLPDMSPAEYAGYFEAIYAARPDVAVVFKLLLHSGADIGEIETRMVRDFRLEGLAARVRYVRTKTNTPERYVPIPQVVAAEVRGHIAAHGLSGSDRVFRMFRRSEIERVHHIGRTAIRRPELTIKNLRHIAAIYWRRAGEDLQTVRDRLGHATIGQTVIYTAFGPTAEAEAEGAEAAAALLMSHSDVTPIASKQAITA